MFSEQFSLWKKHFEQCKKLFEIVIDEEKTGALHQIRSTLAEYDF